MTKEIWIILACVPLYVINSFCDKAVSLKNGNRYNYIYNSIKFLICSLCMFPTLLGESKDSVLGIGSLLCGILCGVMYAVSKTVMMNGYERMSVAFMTLCHASGMILPCIIGHFFWSEPLSIFSIIGILLAVCSIVLLKENKNIGKTLDKKGMLFGVLVFLTSAGVMITQKLMGLYCIDQSIGAYNFYSFVVAFFILSCFAIPKRVPAPPKQDQKTVFLCALASAISLSTISFVMTGLAGSVPSVILFPLFNGSGIIFVCILSAFVFREKLTRIKILGLCLGILGLCLINF